MLGTLKLHKNVDSETKVKVKFFKRRWVKAVGAFLILWFVYDFGHSMAITEIAREKVTYDGLVKEINTKESQVKYFDEKIASIKTNYNDIKTQYDEAVTKIATASNLDTQIQNSQNQLNSLNTQIQSKQNELATLDGQLKAKNEAPVTLPAGQFVVGKDIKAGRYKVVAVGRGSNFKVYNSSGNIVANTIIYSDNSDGFGVSEYVTYLADGYLIDAHDTFKYIPLQ